MPTPLLSDSTIARTRNGEQNTSWHTMLRTPNATIISHLPEIAKTALLPRNPRFASAGCPRK